MELVISAAQEHHWPAIWSLFHRVSSAGDVFAYDESTSEQMARALWFNPPAQAFVAECDQQFVGTYFLRPNHPGRGSHVANAGYMIEPTESGKGFATQLCLHSIASARRLGYRAMQFNLVIETNHAARRVWEKCGFDIVGRLPGAYLHQEHGFVDALLYFRTL